MPSPAQPPPPQSLTRGEKKKFGTTPAVPSWTLNSKTKMLHVLELASSRQSAATDRRGILLLTAFGLSFACFYLLLCIYNSFKYLGICTTSLVSCGEPSAGAIRPSTIKMNDCPYSVVHCRQKNIRRLVIRMFVCLIIGCHLVIPTLNHDHARTRPLS